MPQDHPNAPDILREMHFPVTPTTILRKRHALKRELLAQSNLVPKRIAVLGGSTTSELTAMLELFLLLHGIQPAFYESGYNRYAEDVLLDNAKLAAFRPDVVFLHTTWRNVSEFPRLLEPAADVDRRVRREAARFEALWDKLHDRYGAMIVQNNFDLPPLRPLGNLEAFEPSSCTDFLMRLNAEFAAYARAHSWFAINDIHYLCAQIGLGSWHGGTYWYNFHMAVSPTATVALAQNAAALIQSFCGKSRKCLVLDLDQTLWGGVIGDDGVNHLILGAEHPVGEAHLDFQRYVKSLRERGILLAVCSKNDPAIAKEGFAHPDSVLSLDDFSAFHASWDPKPQAMRAIAAQLNIGLDSLVFVDDNPAERALMRGQLPEVATPEVGSDVARYAEILEAEHYFDVHRIVQDDLSRAATYSKNVQRSAEQTAFVDYGEFLASLEMTAEIAPFAPVYLERIAQLINKTNQFNLTTRRYTFAEVESIAADESYVTLYGRLADKFGDNGLVSVIIGHISGDTLEIDLWLMSCRVLNREMELAMFDALIEQCQVRGVRSISGVYIPSKKNGLVADLYPRLGFVSDHQDAQGASWWRLAVPEAPLVSTPHIRRAAGGSAAALQNASSADAASPAAPAEAAPSSSEALVTR